MKHYLQLARSLINETAKSTPRGDEEQTQRKSAGMRDFILGQGVHANNPGRPGTVSPEFNIGPEDQYSGHLSRNRKSNFMRRHLLPQLARLANDENAEEPQRSVAASELDRHATKLTNQIHDNLVRRGVRRGFLRRVPGGVRGVESPPWSSSKSLGSMGTHDVYDHGSSGADVSDWGELIAGHMVNLRALSSGSSELSHARLKGVLKKDVLRHFNSPSNGPLGSGLPRRALDPVQLLDVSQRLRHNRDGSRIVGK